MTAFSTLLKAVTSMSDAELVERKDALQDELDLVQFEVASRHLVRKSVESDSIWGEGEAQYEYS